MDLGLRGRRAAVMAASQGLGRACALALAREGAAVALCSRDAAKVEAAAKAVAAETGSRVVPVAADVSKAEDVRRFVDAAAAELGGLDILVTNKGGPPAGRFEKHDDAGWQRGFDLVLMSYVRAVRAALPHFRRAGGGAVVAIESTSVKQPILQLPMSSSLRAAVVGLSKTLALEYGHEGIRFNVVLPGSMDTDRIRDLNRAVAKETGRDEEETMRARLEGVPLGRLGTPEELGQFVAFLGSPRASYVTGGVFPVDGGAFRGTW